MLEPLDAILNIKANNRLYSQIQAMKSKLILCLAPVLISDNSPASLPVSCRPACV